jgi:hypothetical protein
VVIILHMCVNACTWMCVCVCARARARAHADTNEQILTYACTYAQYKPQSWYVFAPPFLAIDNVNEKFCIIFYFIY